MTYTFQSPEEKSAVDAVVNVISQIDDADKVEAFIDKLFVGIIASAIEQNRYAEIRERLVRAAKCIEQFSDDPLKDKNIIMFERYGDTAVCFSDDLFER